MRVAAALLLVACGSNPGGFTTTGGDEPDAAVVEGDAGKSAGGARSAGGASSSGGRVEANGGAEHDGTLSDCTTPDVLPTCTADCGGYSAVVAMPGVDPHRLSNEEMEAACNQLDGDLYYLDSRGEIIPDKSAATHLPWSLAMFSELRIVRCCVPE